MVSGMLTGQDAGFALGQTAEIPFAVFLLRAHACGIVRARAAGEAAKEAVILYRGKKAKSISSQALFFFFS